MTWVPAPSAYLQAPKSLEAPREWQEAAGMDQWVQAWGSEAGYPDFPAKDPVGYLVVPGKKLHHLMEQSKASLVNPQWWARRRSRA